MNDHEYDLMRQVEDTYWWYMVLRDAVASMVKEFAHGRAEVRILDAGCGTGGMLARLRAVSPEWRLCGLDMSPQALAHTRKRGFDELAEGSVDSLPYPEESFDVVVSLDVLYFEGVNEMKALSEFQRVLRPGGLLVMNLPAFDVLRGEHDVAVSGVRRYTPFRVQSMLSECNFDAARVHCWNLWLFLPILCWRVLSRVCSGRGHAGAKSDLSELPHFLNQALAFLGRADMAICRVIHSPLGTSVLATARKNPPR